jgi:dTDP-4-dehydrorhamnose reductase
MRVLVLGNKGMLGHVVERYLEEQGHDVVGLNRNDVDFRNDLGLIQQIDLIKPEVIVNCAGILITGHDIKEFTDLNILLPHLLAKESISLDYKLIHISTNCVFRDIGPHSPDETPNATNLYGMSKAFGEIDDNHNLTIRTSITGPELKRDGSGLFNWFVNKTGKEVTGYQNALWNGVSTLQLAKFIESILHQPEITGIVHYYTSKSVDKYHLLKDLNEIYELGKTVSPTFRQDVHSSILKDGYYTTKTLKGQFEEMKDWYDGKKVTISHCDGTNTIATYKV